MAMSAFDVDWIKFVDDALAAMRVRPLKALGGRAPMEVLTGRPGDPKLLRGVEIEQESAEATDDTRQLREEDLEEKQKVVKEVVQLAQEQVKKKRAEASKKPMVTLQPGTYVQLFNPKRTKTQPKFEGLYQVKSMTDLGCAILEALIGSQEKAKHPWNIANLSVVPEDVARKWLSEVATPQNEAIPQEEIYEVEKLLDHKRESKSKNAKMLYKVLWKGYGLDAASWVPEEDILDPALIDNYWSLKKDSVQACIGDAAESEDSSVTEEFCMWLAARIKVPIDLDLFAKRGRMPLAKHGVREFSADAEQMVSKEEMRVLWLNPPWREYSWLGSWVESHARGKALLCLVPSWWTSVMSKWNVRWWARLPVPKLMRMFKWPSGEVRPSPPFKVFLWIGVVE